jgi:DNA-binding beta-propeller fold protein YncE
VSEYPVRRDTLISMRTGMLAAALSLTLLSAADKKTVTLIGTGVAGSENGQINNPYGLVTGPDGALYICEIGNHRVGRLDLKTKQYTIVAGTAKMGYSGDGGPATKAELNEPYEIRFDRAGNMFFVEMKNNIVRRVDKKTGTISTVAGTGKPGFSGDGGPANKAQFNQPHSIAFDPKGRLLICDIANHRVRRVDMKTGIIETWGGTGEKKPTPDGSTVKGTPLNGPRAIALDPQGNLYIALREGNSVYKIDGKTEKITHLAGTGKQGNTGNGGPAKEATLSGPKGISWSPDGAVYIADTESHSIRRIDLKTGMISTAAGAGQRGDGPDGDPLQCKMSRPHGIFIDKKGRIFIGDSEAHRVRLLE